MAPSTIPPFSTPPAFLPTQSQVCSFSPVLIATASSGVMIHHPTGENVPPARPQSHPHLPLPAGLAQVGCRPCHWGSHGLAGETRSPRANEIAREGSRAWAGSTREALEEDLTGLAKGSVGNKEETMPSWRINTLNYFISLTLSFTTCKMGVVTKPTA